MSSSLTDKFEKMDLTSEELKRLTNAFEKEEFRKLFAEYAEEISNPENRTMYENEIRELEKERGMDVTFVHPEPGYVLSTSTNGITKTYINICKSDHVASPTKEKKNDSNGRVRLSWSIPHLFSQPREDFTRNKKKCLVYDFVVHPYTFRLAETNPRFKYMINDIVIDGLQKMFNVVLDTYNCKQIKMKYKGQITCSVIRSRILNVEVNAQDDIDILTDFPYPYVDESSTEKAERMSKDDVSTSEENYPLCNFNQSDFSKPKYELRYQSDVDIQKYFSFPNSITDNRPQRLVIEVFLPLLTSASSINLDVFENSIKLESHKPAKYHLELSLPYPVDENASSARFDKTKRQLTIALTVLTKKCFTNGSTNQQFEFDVNLKLESLNREGSDMICDLHKESLASENTSKEFCDKIVISESHEKIAVICEKDPVLQGILKQRSISDSFEGQFRDLSEQSNNYTEYPEEEDMSHSLPSSFGSKKSVSFSSYIDQTVYRTNQSVSTLHATLKNKRKKNKKREQRQEYQKFRLERKKSNSFGNLSDNLELQETQANEDSLIILTKDILGNLESNVKSAPVGNNLKTEMHKSSFSEHPTEETNVFSFEKYAITSCPLDLENSHIFSLDLE